MPNQRALISKGRIRRRNLGSGRCDGTNSSPLAPNRSVFLLSPATQSGPPLFPTPLPLFKTAKIRFFVGFVIRYRGNLMGRENSEDTLQLSPHSISTFPIPIRPTHPPSLPPSLPPFADPPFSLWATNLRPRPLPPSRYIPFASRMERQFRYFLLFLFLLQIMAALAQKEKWEGSNSGRRVYFRVRAALARLGS